MTEAEQERAAVVADIIASLRDEPDQWRDEQWSGALAHKTKGMIDQTGAVGTFGLPRKMFMLEPFSKELAAVKVAIQTWRGEQGEWSDVTRDYVHDLQSKLDRATDALEKARDLIDCIKQTSNNLWWVEADDPETAVCDTHETARASLAFIKEQSDD